MKVTGARNEPLSAALRRTAAARSAGAAAVEPKASDQTQVLGLAEADLTPAVVGALQTLTQEIESLRAEVAQLKARLAEAEGLADRDGLTPLLNRRAFLRELSRVRTFVQRYGAPASVIFFDLDGFKQINDRFGHAAGDSVLQAVASRLAAQVREFDVVARMGGDEFAVILVQVDQDTAEAKAAGLAQAVEGSPVTFGDMSASLRISYGVREITAQAEGEAALAEADAAMYARKRARRAG